MKNSIETHLEKLVSVFHEFNAELEKLILLNFGGKSVLIQTEKDEPISTKLNVAPSKINELENKLKEMNKIKDSIYQEIGKNESIETISPEKVNELTGLVIRELYEIAGGEFGENEKFNSNNSLVGLLPTIKEVVKQDNDLINSYVKTAINLIHFTKSFVVDFRDIFVELIERTTRNKEQIRKYDELKSRITTMFTTIVNNLFH